MNSLVGFICMLGEMVTNNAERCWRCAKNNMDAIGILIVVCSPLCQLFCKTTRSSIITNMLIIWLGLMLISIDKIIHNKKNGIPVMRKRFVHYNKSNNKVSIKKDDWNEVVNYLADLQEYFEEEGML